MPDQLGPAATGRDTGYSITIEQAADLYARAGHPRTLRTVQRYCASGHLDCVKEATMLGDRYFVEPSSVARHISQIEELIALDTRASGRDVSRSVATPVAGHFLESFTTTPDRVSQPVATNMDVETASRVASDARQPASPVETPSRLAATDNDALSRVVAGLEREVERALEDRTFLREQIATKDKQIDALLERDRETNILVRGLQQMLSPLLGPARREVPDDPSQSF